MNLPLPAPFPHGVLLSYLRSRCVPGVEVVGELTYTRLSEGPLTARFLPEEARVVLEAPGEPGPEEAARFTRLFQIQRDWSAPEPLRTDALLSPLIDRVPGFRPLGCWEPFELCLRTIVGQQVSVAAAGTLMKRLGERAPAWTPEAVASADLDAMGMPGTRIRTLRTLAERAAAGDIPWTLPWPDLREALARLPGFGPWTLDYLGIRLGRDLDAFPAADLGLMRGAGVTTSRALLARAEAWRPYRGWAASYLWMG